MNAVEQALALSRAQLERLRAGDTDGYIAALSAQELACTAALQGPPGPIEQMRELEAVNAQIVAEIERQRDESRERMALLNRTRSSSSSYLTGATPAPHTTREA